MGRRTLGALGLLVLVLVMPRALTAGVAERFQLESFSAPARFYGAWHVKRWAGTVGLAFLSEGSTPYLQLTCPASSWAFYRRTDVDLRRTPFLSWSWKADVLPAGGDGRRRATDDEAGQVYILFPGRGLLSPLTERILVYTWETVPPKGSLYTPERNADTRVFVLQSAADGLGVWRRERRNVARDFRAAFGEEAPKPVGISFQIDSDDTRSMAQASFADIAFVSE